MKKSLRVTIIDEENANTFNSCREYTVYSIYMGIVSHVTGRFLLNYQELKFCGAFVIPDLQ